MFRIENVWRRNDPALPEELRKLLRKSRGTVPADEAEKMIASVAFVAWSADGSLAGFSSAIKHRLSLLNDNTLFELSLVIAEPFYQSSIQRELTTRSFEFLSGLAENDPQKPVGLFSVFKDETDKNKVAWPEHEMYLIGFTRDNFPIAVRYFKGARI